MSFSELREKPQQKIHYLRDDWTIEETRFKKGHAEFINDISIANSIDVIEYGFEEKNISQESVTESGVNDILENKIKIFKEQGNVSVESNNVRGPSQIGSSTLQLAQQESRVKKEIDPFDDVIESNTPSNYSKTKSVDEDIFGDSKSVKKDSDSDLFDLESSSQAPAAKPSSPQPVSVVPVKSTVTTQVAESAMPAKPSIYDPINDPEGAARADNYVKSKQSANQSGQEFNDSDCCKNIDGFDSDKFTSIRTTLNKILKNLPDVDLDSIMADIDNHNYIVSMDMDYLRGNPNVLTEKLLEIQSKRDSLYVNTLRLTPLSASFKHAGEYLIEAGIICSDASSKEKREAQVKNALPEFWVRNSYVARTKTQVDRAFEQLAWQYDTISRLITIAQMNNKIGNVSRGELPFEPKEEIPFDPPYAESPKPEAKQQNTPVGNVDDNFVNRSMSQPLNSSKKFENLESFVSGTKPAKKTNQSITTGEIDW